MQKLAFFPMSYLLTIEATTSDSSPRNKLPLYVLRFTVSHLLCLLSPLQLGGCGLFGVGVWLSFTQSEFSSLPLSFPSLSAANLLLVAGGVTMVTGFLGCLGALKEQRCLLMTVSPHDITKHGSTSTMLNTFTSQFTTTHKTTHTHRSKGLNI